MKTHILVAIATLPLLVGCEYFVGTETRIERATQAWQRGDFGAAVVQLRNVLDREPTNLAARLQLIDALLKNDDAEAARNVLEPLLDEANKNNAVAALVVRVRVALNDGTGLLKKLEAKELALTPAQSAFALAQVHAMSREMDAAQRDYESAIAQAGDDDATKLGASLGLVEIYVARNEIERAFAVLRPFDAARAERLRGLLYARIGESGAALQAFDAAKGRNHGDLSRFEYTTMLAALLEQQIALQQLPKADTTLSEMSERDAASAIVVLAKAQLAYAKKDYAAAASGLQSLLTKQNTLTPARLLLAQALFAQEHWQQSEQHALQVINEQPQNVSARVLLAKLYLRDGRKAKALEVSAPVEVAASPDPAASALVAKAQEAVAGDDAAIKEVSESVQRKPSDEALRVALASTYVRARKPDLALQLLRDQSQSASTFRTPILLGAAAAQSGIDGAKREAERLMQAHANDARYPQIIGRFFLQNRQPDIARDWLRRASTLAPNDMGLQLEYAQVALATGEVATSERVVDQLLARDRANLAATLLKAECAARQGNTADALRTLDNAARDFPWSAQAVLAAGSLRLRLGDFDKAKLNLSEAANRANRADTWVAIGRAWAGAKRFTEASEALTKAVQLQPRSGAYWRALAEVELAGQRYEQARNAAKEALAINAEDLSALRIQSAADFKLGKGTDALANARVFRQAHPQLLDAALLEADALFETQQFAAAAALYEELLEKLSTGQARLTAETHAGTALALKAVQARQLGKLDSPIKPLEQWVAKHDDVQSRIALADAYRSGGQSDRAMEIYQQMLSRNPNDVAALNNIALLYLEKGNPKAIESARKANSLQPKVPAIADTYGWVLLQMGKTSEALPLLAQAAAADGSPEIQYHYAAGLARSGEVEKAKETLSKALAGTGAFNGRTDAEQLLASLEKRAADK